MLVAPPSSTHLIVESIRVGYAQGSRTHEIVHGLSFSLGRGEIGCLLGPSGCGKTTVLRAIAGFEGVIDGRIALGGRELSRAGHTAPPETRQVGVVFQDYALFPHLSVWENVAFGLLKLPQSVRKSRVERLLDLVGLGAHARQYPHELSGGQQQRVALARALAPQPDLLLLDEPFSNLDVDLRERLAQEVRDILNELGTTAVLVTHDQHEAFAIADRIGVMQEGVIVQWDDAYNLYHRPANRFVADFIGQGVFVPGNVDLPAQKVCIELGSLPLWQGIDFCATGEREGGQVDVLLRADDVIHDDASPLQAEVVRKAFRGAEFLYTLKLPSGQKLLALVPSHHDHALGEKIGIRLGADHVVTFPPAA
ncbi:ABC transporter ATP-binding protein [Noviherbaspirillum aridicola]|uniref:Iron ABC transporter ATP-binding protein n=1 Tax=Noviherbaspirillum aridicola TaxID=2849687 RepID=A0ABQ4Q1H4_9BURK|nr:ABC transporter ATP-binding protein [Noviherbaspirillum aridicola]GIZ50614.1 iron ABC transporter ATP-binding protein [Noviherbaspirillum aridicola]